jgi:hypothetical protein
MPIANVIRHGRIKMTKLSKSEMMFVKQNNEGIDKKNAVAILKHFGVLNEL